MQRFKAFLKKSLKILRTSAVMATVVAAISAIYSLIAHGRLLAAYAFTANFAVGAVVILGGLVLLFVPTRLTGGKFFDPTSLTPDVMDARERKRIRAHEIMYTGMGIIIIAAILQYLLSLF
jgi:hypothetical protein